MNIYTHGTIVNIYIVFELRVSSSDDATLKNSLFGAVSLTKNADIDILVMELDLIENQVFHFQMVDLVKM